MSQAAMEIIVKEGYDSLSIRRLSKQLKISQTTLYNYFKNRDEIYIYMLNHGFEMLYQELENSYDVKADPIESLRRLCKVSFTFAIRERNLVFIMLILDTPKYLDYLETDYEPSMRVELSNALKCKDVFARVITEISGEYQSLSSKDIPYRTFSVINQLIGLAAIFNNNLIKYLFDDIDAVVERILDDIVLPFKMLKK
jgi:AcrR family transcriptional regulator